MRMDVFAHSVAQKGSTAGRSDGVPTPCLTACREKHDEQTNACEGCMPSEVAHESAWLLLLKRDCHYVLALHSNEENGIVCSMLCSKVARFNGLT